MSYESWRISFQSSEQAARAAYAEAEALRAEVERLRRLVQERDTMLGKRLCAGTNADGKPRCLAPAEEHARAERLRAEVARLEVIAGYGGVSSDAPERLILASEVYDGVQSCDKWCDVRRVVDDGQPMPESATAYVRADRAERLEEALRELVDVFSESGMYDEEVFDKARAALAHGGEE